MPVVLGQVGDEFDDVIDIWWPLTITIGGPRACAWIGQSFAVAVAASKECKPYFHADGETTSFASLDHFFDCL